MGCSRCNYVKAPHTMQDEKVTLESSNSGVAGRDTGYVFRSPKTSALIRVMAHPGESDRTAISRVRSRHGLR